MHRGEEKWVAYVAHTGEKRNGWHMWHAQGRREMGGICGTHRGEEKWVAYVPRTGEKRNAYRVLVGKTERKTPLEKTQMQMGG